MKKIISLMQNIGFTQYESQVYLALLQQSNVTGYELAKICGVPASKIYQILNKLTPKEVVLAIDSDPVKYAPLPPDVILSRIKDDYLQTLNQLDDKLENVYSQEDFSNNFIWHLSERAAIIRKVIEFIDSAADHLFLSVWDEEVDEITKALSDAQQRGVKITIVHFGKKLLGLGNEYQHGGEHRIRIERGGRRIALIVDNKKVILGHFQEDGSCNAAWTANKVLVLLAKDYIIHDIYTIRIVQKYGEEAMDIFEKV